MTPQTTSSLRDRLDGHLLLPGDTGYDAARAVWNGMVDRRPQMIVRCATVEDVVTAVRTGRELGLDIGVRCGGHSVVGHAVPDGGLMIDLTPMGGVRVDPERRMAWVQGGALLGALDRASQEYGLATTAGNVSHTGVGGLTLGGGMGWLARRYGLACDNVESFEVVTADGRVLRASATEHPDLDWGLRGGGGNFGIVTEFVFRLHEIGTQAMVAEASFPADQSAQVLRGWRDLGASVPRSATLTASLTDELTTVGFVWVGPPDEGARLVPSIQALGRPVSERVFETSYVELQRLEDSIEGPALRRYWKGHYFRALTDEAIDAITDRSGAPPLPNVGLQSYGGAISEVAEDATAFSFRDAAFELVAASRWSDPAEDEARIDGARRYAAGLEPYAYGVYVNALNDEGLAGVRRAYSPDKFARLARVKDDYDPENVFHLNQNIRPARADS